MSIDLDGLLRGTPYSLDPARLVSGELDRLEHQEHEARVRFAEVSAAASERRLTDSLSEIQVTREIHESNSIEGLGPEDIAGTWAIRQSDAGTHVREALEHAVLTRSLQSDPEVRSVLGLEGARLLAERIRQGQGAEWQVSEADIRALHNQICKGEAYAGMYKRYHVRIGGEDAHEPHLPTDVSGAMGQLVRWLRAPYDGPALLKAATAHAWLTHIHPFEDGNGRVARLLANLILTHRGLPPAIVKNRTQRSPYLNALRHSDQGGDILPLAGLFKDTTKRYIREYAKPAFLDRVFRNEIMRRGSSLFDWWSNELEKFTNRLESELRLHSLKMNRLGSLDRESFDYLRALNPQGNSWLLTVSDLAKHEVLLWFGYPSVGMQIGVRSDDYRPSLFFSVPQRQLSLQPYQQADAGQLRGLTEMMLVPGVPTRMRMLINDQVRELDAPDAARLLSDLLAEVMADGLVPSRWDEF